MILPAVKVGTEKASSSKLTFNKLTSYLKFSFSLLPDKRPGFNTIYSIQDAALSAFSVFFTQCPSFLAYQTQMQETKGENNASSLFQINKIPSDNQVRNLLDPINPSNLHRVYEHIYEELRLNGFLEKYRSCLNNTLLIPMDGVCYHSSEAIFCEKCSHQQHKNGTITHTHSAITPVIVAPGNEHVITLPPEFITPQDGHNKQDSEQAAIKRWLQKHVQTYGKLGITFLGDDLYAHQPTCEAIIAAKCHFLFTCKPDSHKTLYEFLDGLDNLGKVQSVTINWRHGKKHYIDTYRFINNLPLRDGDDALSVNWCELVTTNADGKVIYRNSFVTDHLITNENIVDVIKAGRARWKIENENNNTLKTKGYNLEHNFGHGDEYLSHILLSMNLLAFLFHTVLSLIDESYQLIRAKLPSRKTFFDDMRALTRYIYFDDWQTLMDFMMFGLKLKRQNSS